MTPELVQWVLGFGGDAYVIEPQELQKEVNNWAEGTVALYLKKAS